METDDRVQRLLSQLSNDHRLGLRSDDGYVRGGGPTGFQWIRADQKNDSWLGGWLSTIAPDHAKSIVESAVRSGATTLETLDAALITKVDGINLLVANALKRMRQGDAWFGDDNNHLTLVVGDAFYGVVLSAGQVTGSRQWMEFQVERALRDALCEGRQLNLRLIEPSLRGNIEQQVDPDSILEEIRSGRVTIGGGLTDTRWSMFARGGKLFVIGVNGDREEEVSDEEARRVVRGVYELHRR